MSHFDGISAGWQSGPSAPKKHASRGTATADGKPFHLYKPERVWFLGDAEGPDYYNMVTREGAAAFSGPPKDGDKCRDGKARLSNVRVEGEAP